MDQLMQRGEAALVQQRVHADKLRRGSMTSGASGDERRDPDVACWQGVPETHPESEEHKSPREQEQKRSGEGGGDAPRAGGVEEPMRTAAEDEPRIEKISRFST